MALFITEECISCGVCEPECPNQAIGQGTDVFAVDAARCTECEGFYPAPQCVDVCPVECIIPAA